nr:class I SAM-dependent methyltransferase [Streptomyces harenosi]
MEADDSLKTFFEGERLLENRTEREADGVIKLCGLKPGDALVDCPSGYGRHSVALAERGLNVTGVDINTRFLGLARERAARHGVAVNFVQGDMRKLPAVGPADAVINMFYSFGFFTEEEDVQVARGFQEILRPGGKFLMHTMVTVPAFADGRIPLEERRKLRSGSTLVSRRRLNPVSRREEGIWSLLDDDGTERSLTPYDARIYTDEEFTALCREAGFSEVEVYGDWDGRPYEDSAPYLIAVATK